MITQSFKHTYLFTPPFTPEMARISQLLANIGDFTCMILNRQDLRNRVTWHWSRTIVIN